MCRGDVLHVAVTGVAERKSLGLCGECPYLCGGCFAEDAWVWCLGGCLLGGCHVFPFLKERSLRSPVWSGVWRVLVINTPVGWLMKPPHPKKFFSLPGVYAPPTPGASSPLLLNLERTHRPTRSPTSLGSPITAIRNASMNFFSHDEKA